MADWAHAVGEVIGAVVPLERVYELGVRWYGRRLRLDWERPDAAAIDAIFRAVGLTGDFWSSS